MDQLPSTLVDLLSTTLVLRQIAPHIPVASLLALASTSKALRSLIYTSPDTFRHLDLSSVKSAITDTSPIDSGGQAWRAGRMDESLTEEDFFSGPLRGIFSRLDQRNVLRNVKTLVLDGMSVPAELVREIIAEDRFNVNILSIREVKNLNLHKLQQVLHYAVRPTRAKGMPRLKALYVFSPRDKQQLYRLDDSVRYNALSSSSSSTGGIMCSEGAQIGAEWSQRAKAVHSSPMNQPLEKWYSTNGKVMKTPSIFWADTLQACRGIIAFDAVLCRGPMHDPVKTPAARLLAPAIATIALSSKGCESCGSCPEKAAVFGQDAADCFPLLTPPPCHASTVHAAQYPTMPNGGPSSSTLILRCEDCLRGRWCERCNKWWCEDCYDEPVSRAQPTELQQIELRQDLQNNGWGTASSVGPVKGVHRDCFDCGRTCIDCKYQSIRRCQSPGCNSEYCFVHAEGSSATRCDWCGYRGGRRTRELY